MKPHKVRKEFTRKKLGIELKKYKHWTLYLSPKQYYLGKLRLVINRKIVDLTELKKPEYEEFIKITKAAKKALDKAFKPDLYNYATLGNWIRHHHWHIIPRYKKIRKINRTIFKDNHWNNPAWPNPKKKISKETESIIFNKIKENL